MRPPFALRPAASTGLAIAFALALAGVLAAAPARAQTIEDRLRAQLVIVTQQLHEAQAAQSTQAQPSAATAADPELKARLAKAQADLAAARRAQHAASQAEAARAAAAPAEAEARALAAREHTALGVAQAALAHATDDLGRLRADHDRVSAGLAADETSLATCRAKTAEAIGVARVAVAAYHRMGVADVLARREPLTGLARVHYEQLEQDWGDKLYDSRLDVPPKKPLPAAGTPK